MSKRKRVAASNGLRPRWGISWRKYRAGEVIHDGELLAVRARNRPWVEDGYTRTCGLIKFQPRHALPEQPRPVRIGA